MDVPLAQDHVLLALHLDLEAVLGVEQHLVARLHRPHVRARRRPPRPRPGGGPPGRWPGSGCRRATGARPRPWPTWTRTRSMSTVIGCLAVVGAPRPWLGSPRGHGTASGGPSGRPRRASRALRPAGRTHAGGGQVGLGLGHRVLAAGGRSTRPARRRRRPTVAPSTRWSRVPTPPEATTGTPTASTTARVSSEVEAVAGAVAVHRGEQDLPGPEPRRTGSAQPSASMPGRVPPAVGVHLPAGPSAPGAGRRWPPPRTGRRTRRPARRPARGGRPPRCSRPPCRPRPAAAGGRLDGRGPPRRR